MQITMFLHLGHHSMTLIFEMPLLLPLIIVVLLSLNLVTSWFPKARPGVSVGH
jgi:hypothetical protein